MKYNIAIRNNGDVEGRQIGVEADNWMLALRKALSMIRADPVELGAAICEIAEDSTVLLSDPRSGRSFLVSGETDAAEQESGPEPSPTITYLEAEVEKAVKGTLDLRISRPSGIQPLPFIKISTREKELLGLERKPGVPEPLDDDGVLRRKVQYFSVVKVDVADQAPRPAVAATASQMIRRLLSQEMSLALGQDTLPLASGVITAALAKALSASLAWLLVPGVNGAVSVLASSGASDSGLAVNLDKGEPASLALTEGIGICLVGASASARKPVLLSQALWDGCGGLLCIPIYCGDTAGAVFQLYKHVRDGAFSEKDMIVAEQAANAFKEVMHRFRPCGS